MIAFLLSNLEKKKKSTLFTTHKNVFSEKGSNPHQSSSVSWEGPYKTMQQLP